MSVSSLSEEDKILLSIKYLYSGLSIPNDLRDGIDPVALQDLDYIRGHYEHTGKPDSKSKPRLPS